MWCSSVCAVSLLCSLRGGVVAAVEKELNNRVCVCVSSCVWVEYCCLLHYHRRPSPLTSYSNYSQRERGEEEGGSEGKEREREGE